MSQSSGTKNTDTDRSPTLPDEEEKEREEIDAASPLITLGASTDWRRLYHSLGASAVLFNAEYGELSGNKWEDWFMTEFPCEFLEDNAGLVADWLHAHRSRLDPRVFKEYFHTLGPRQQAAHGARARGARYRHTFLRAFIDRMNFRGMHFEWAIRSFFAVCWLPHSSKAIDRMLHMFGEAFIRQVCRRMS